MLLSGLDTVIMTSSEETSQVTSEISENVTAEERWRLLEQLNAENMVLLLPTVVLLLLVALVGLLGNALVLHVYRRKFPPSTMRCFVLSLATVDVLACVVAIPGELVEFRYHYSFDSEPLCRLIRFNNTLIPVASGLIIIPMAVDRFRRVCQPFKRQMTSRVAMVTVLASCLASLLLSLPISALSGASRRETRWSGVRSCVCSLSDEYRFSSLPLVFVGVYFLVLAACLVTLVALYSKIGMAIWKRKHFQDDRSHEASQGTPHSRETSLESLDPPSQGGRHRPLPAPPSLVMTSPHVAAADGKKGDEVRGGSSHETFLPVTAMEGEVHGVVPGGEEGSDQSQRRLGTPARGEVARSRPWYVRSCCWPFHRKPPPSSAPSSNDVSASRTTVIFFLIVVVFVLTFLPLLILVLIRLLDHGFMGRLTESQVKVFNVFMRTFYLNAASNPIIYGVLNTRFRNECKKVFRRSR